MIDITKIIIKTMEKSDLDLIKDVINTDFDEFWSYDNILNEIKNENSEFLVCIYDNEIIGFGGIRITLDIAELMFIVIRKDFRNQGIAKLLLNTFIQIAKENSLSCIQLEVNENNEYAIKLYRDFDFKEVGLRKKYYMNKYDAILFTLEL